MPPRTSSAGKHRSTRPIFAGVDRQAPRAQRPKPAGGTLSLIGKRCRLFEDESGLAAELEAGQHLLPCFGDEATTVDRFDARLLLTTAPAASRSRANALAPDGQDDAELDAERYRDLWREGSESNGSDAVGAPLRPGGAAIPHDYGGSSAAPGSSFQQVGFDYGGQQPGQLAAELSTTPAANREQRLEQQGDLFVAPFAVPKALQANLPETMQQHKVIAQTAGFVREAGGQSEFRLGVAQAGNPNFAFLRPGDRLFPYYRWLLQATPDDSTAARSASLPGPTGLDMLAASYDTDQASDPPTPRAEVQPPPAAAGGDALLAAAGDPTAGAAAASTIDGSSAAAQPAVAAAASEADGAAVEAQPQSSEPQGHPGFPAAAVAPPLAAALPAATQAIMNKLIGFVKAKGAAVGLALQRREAANLRFSFLQPDDPLHAAWRAAAVEGLGADVAAQLLPAAAAGTAGGAIGDAAAAAASAEVALPAAAPVASGSVGGSGSGTPGSNTAPAAAEAARGSENRFDAAGTPADAAVSGSGAAFAEAGAAGTTKPLAAGSSSVGDSADASAAPAGSGGNMPVVFSAPEQPLKLGYHAEAAVSHPAAEAPPMAKAATSAALSRPVAVIRSNPQLARRIVGPLPQPKPKAATAKSSYASALADLDDSAAAVAEAGEAAAPAGAETAAAGVQEDIPAAGRAAPPWLTNPEAAGSGSGSDSPGPAGGTSAAQTPAEQQAATKKARRLKAVREALAAKQRAEADQRRAAAAAAAEEAARAAAAAAAERRRLAEAAAAEARHRRRVFMGEEGAEPDAAAQPPLLRQRPTPEELWARLQPASAVSRVADASAVTAMGVGGGGAAAAGGADAGTGGQAGGDGGSGSALSQQQLGMSVGSIMAQLRAAEAGEAAAPQPGEADGVTAASGAASSAVPATSAAVLRSTSPAAGSSSDNGNTGSGSERDGLGKVRRRQSHQESARRDKRRGSGSRDKPKSSGSKRHRREDGGSKGSKHKRSKH